VVGPTDDRRALPPAPFPRGRSRGNCRSHTQCSVSMIANSGWPVAANSPAAMSSAVIRPSQGARTTVLFRSRSARASVARAFQLRPRGLGVGDSLSRLVCLQLRLLQRGHHGLAHPRCRVRPAASSRPLSSQSTKRPGRTRPQRRSPQLCWHLRKVHRARRFEIAKYSNPPEVGYGANLADAPNAAVLWYSIELRRARHQPVPFSNINGVSQWRNPYLTSARRSQRQAPLR
jgi:hypothetical protein